jgi:hypothetical protein
MKRRESSSVLSRRLIEKARTRLAQPSILAISASDTSKFAET